MYFQKKMLQYLQHVLQKLGEFFGIIYENMDEFVCISTLDTSRSSCKSAQREYDK